jgi:4-amino-4-deoxy-L-arabinose transferase-like glycosyltransferase
MSPGAAARLARLLAAELGSSPASCARSSKRRMGNHEIDSGSPAPTWLCLAPFAVVALAAGLMLIDLTRSGYGNSYYAAGALAASHSWGALFSNAADLGDYVSLDKGPLPDWLQGFSGRLFGFGNFSTMLPNALYGIATVIVLYDTVRRSLGRPTAILAALGLALTPVAVLVGRYNTPDALLLLLLVCAAWSMTVAIQSGRRRELMLCAVLVGLAFNTKMLEAYLALAPLALAYLLAARGSAVRRVRELALAGALALLVSFAWFGSVMLVPAGERPYVDESTNNSWFQLIFEGNGVQRVAGTSGAFVRNLESNLLYISSARLAGQIAWLLPLAVLGLVLGLLMSWRSRRTSLAFGTYAMWGAWLLIDWAVLSFSAGARHAYYSSILAPAVATLAAAGLVMLWRLARGSPLAAGGLALALAGSAVVGFAVLADSPTFLPWLRWVVLACGAVAGAAVLAPHLRGRRGAGVGVATSGASAVAIGAASLALLGGPAAYSVVTAERAHTGYDPTAGPPLGERTRTVAVSSTAFAAVPSSSATPSASAVGAATVALLVPYLQAHRDDARFLVAATDATTAAPIALATRQPVITIGGYTGADPTPSAHQIEGLIDSGQLRYAVLDAARVMPASRLARATAAPAWIERHCALVPGAFIAPLATGDVVRSAWRIASKLTLYACGSAAP